MRSSEHLLSHIAFFAMNIFVALKFLKNNLPATLVSVIIKLATFFVPLGLIVVFVGLTASGSMKFSARTLVLLIPGYADTFIPLVASVSEHSKTDWTSFYINFNNIMLFVPLGLYLILFYKNTFSHGKLFIGLYGLSSVYFAAGMVRLQLILGPAACLIAAIGASWMLRKGCKSIKINIFGIGKDKVIKEEKKAVVADESSTKAAASDKKKKKNDANKKQEKSDIEKNKDEEEAFRLEQRKTVPLLVGFSMIAMVFWLSGTYITFCNMFSKEYLSNPSIIES